MLPVLWILAGGTIGQAMEPFPPADTRTIEADICVYGGTPGGVVAAVKAARLGKRVVLVESESHIGGMMTSGLGVADIGLPSSLGGIAREVYRRIGRAYGSAESFRYEPHIAEMVFTNMLAEHQIRVFCGQPLANVGVLTNHIVSIGCGTGHIFRASVFVDASYEGDLMASAGVGFVVGREPRDTYNESLNGMLLNSATNVFRGVQIDPYRIPGDTNSGLLAFVEPEAGGVVGQGDSRVQAYNYRLCLTQIATNRLPVAPPANYSEGQYELLRRYIQARVNQGDTLMLGSDLLQINPVPNGKADVNALGPFSSDFVGASDDYPEGTPATRAQICQAHQDYIRGLLYYLGTSSNVPVNVREDMQTWGLCRDEFQDNEGWPRCLYVREARRMVSDYVMTQANCEGTSVAVDSISLAAYGMESHTVRQFVDQGKLAQEGAFYLKLPAPYPVSYRAIVPSRHECDNLFVTFCISASHVAFCSYRLEPAVMAASEAAGTAASFAIDDNVPVQDVNIAKLQRQLIADGHVLEWNLNPSPGVVADNADSNTVRVGLWYSSSSAAGYYGSDYLHDGSSGKGTKSIKLRPTLPTNGQYEVLLRWTAAENRATNTPVDVIHALGVTTTSIDQQQRGGEWVSLGVFTFDGSSESGVVIRNAGTSGKYVVADAAWFKPTFVVEKPVVDVLATDPQAGLFPQNPGRFTFVRTGSADHDLTVAYLVGGTATNGLGYGYMSGTITLPAGTNSVPVDVVPLPDTCDGAVRTVSVTVAPAADYTVGDFSNATCLLHARPYDEWKSAWFTNAMELCDPLVSGPSADADGDGLPNLLEYVLGQDPTVPRRQSEPLLDAGTVDGDFVFTFSHLKGAADAEIGLEFSTDMLRWDYLEDMEAARIVDCGLTEKVWMRLAIPADRPRFFVRQRVTLLP